MKQYRLDLLGKFPEFEFHKLDITDQDAIEQILRTGKVRRIVHLAAQAGVRYSIENPSAYEHSNLAGHLSILEAARKTDIEHLVYASSSSIYGANTKTPFCETDMTDSPVSFYGATKKSNELMSTSYANIHKLPQTGLRFFTVYGPAGRPDMAYWIFTEKMLAGEPIDVFNHGKMGRDFTYIGDIVDGLIAALDTPPSAEDKFHRIFNLGNDHPEELMTLITLLEDALGIKADKNFCDMQKGDVERTWADIDYARKTLGYAPKIRLEDGIKHFAQWRLSLNEQLI